MSTVTCLVEVEGTDVRRKFQFCCDGGSVAASVLRDAVRECSLLSSKVDTADLLFKVYDTDFKCFVALVDEDKIPHLSTVRLSSSGDAQTSTSQVAVIPHKARQLTSGSSTDLTEHISDGADRDGKDYELPDFGALHDSLVTLSNRENVRSSLENKIVEVLYQSMASITLYPSRIFYYKAVSQLLDRYSHLRDVIGSGFDSWLVALRNKFKNERRKLENNAQVQEKRAKFGSRRRSGSDDITPESGLQRTKRQEVAANAASHEDMTSLNSHEEWLRSEDKKRNPDEAQMKIRMVASHSARGADLASVSVREALQKYPYIKDTCRFFNDFETLTVKPALQPVETGVAEVVSLTLKGTITSSKPLLEILQQVPHHHDKCARRKKHILAVAALRILGRCLHECRAVSQLFVRKDADYVPPTPCILYSGPTVEDAQDMHLHVEQEQVLRVIDAEEGIAAVFAAYWLFHAKYCKNVFNLMTLMECHWFKLGTVKPRAPVIKLMNKIVNVK